MEQRKLKIIAIVLKIMLVISIIGIIITFLYHHIQNAPVSVIVTNNIIAPKVKSSRTITDEYTFSNDTVSYESNSNETYFVSDTNARAISLYNMKPEDNIPFQVSNMFPGDIETRYYCIEVSYKGDITLRYHANIRQGYEKLAEVLKVKISLPETNELLYDGLMKDMPEALNHPLYTNTSTQSKIYYEITTYLDTSVGNEYMYKELIADFNWWIEETSQLDFPDDVSSILDFPNKVASLLDSPDTGDINIYLIICIALASFVGLIYTFKKPRKEINDEH